MIVLCAPRAFSLLSCLSHNIASSMPIRYPFYLCFDFVFNGVVSFTFVICVSEKHCSFFILTFHVTCVLDSSISFVGVFHSSFSPRLSSYGSSSHIHFNAEHTSIRSSYFSLSSPINVRDDCLFEVMLFASSNNVFYMMVFHPRTLLYVIFPPLFYFILCDWKHFLVRFWFWWRFLKCIIC